MSQDLEILYFNEISKEAAESPRIRICYDTKAKRRKCSSDIIAAKQFFLRLKDLEKAALEITASLHCDPKEGPQDWRGAWIYRQLGCGYHAACGWRILRAGAESPIRRRLPFSYEGGVNLPKAIIQWLKGEPVDPATLQPEYGRMFAKNDLLVEVK